MPKPCFILKKSKNFKSLCHAPLSGCNFFRATVTFFRAACVDVPHRVAILGTDNSFQSLIQALRITAQIQMLRGVHFEVAVVY